MLVWRKNFKEGNCPSLGLFAAPYFEFPELFLSSGLGVNASSTHKVSSLRRDEKIEKFATKTKFKKAKGACSRRAET
jgi:hypothetical protein